MTDKMIRSNEHLIKNDRYNDQAKETVIKNDQVKQTFDKNAACYMLK